MKAFHFLAEDRRMARTGELVEAGKTYHVDGPVKMCRSGLHGSVKPLDALQYASGPVVCRVDITGDIVVGDDKIVGCSRKVLWMYDASPELNRFGRLCALDVANLWDAPDVVLQYLKTGDEAIRSAALDAARDAARSAITDESRNAAAAAVRNSIGHKSMYAASYAADDVVAAMAAVRDASWYAVWVESWSAARATARDAARKKQNDRLYRMLMAGRK